jgi:hypothetical protein
MLRTGLIRHGDVTLGLATPKGWLAADARAKPYRCKAKQGRHGKRALTSGAYFHISTVFGRRR